MERTVFIVTSMLGMFSLQACAPQVKTASTNQPEVSEIVEKYWKLTELSGRPVPRAEASQREAHIILKLDGNRVQGNAGCNSLTGIYELKGGNRIAFSRIAVTKMACPYMDVEIQFLKVLNTADNYTVRGDTLTLNRARMAPLARFDAVYMK